MKPQKILKLDDSFSNLPFYVIIDTLRFHEFSISYIISHHQISDLIKYSLFGYFKKDRFRKIFQVFNSLFVQIIFPEGNKENISTLILSKDLALKKERGMKLVFYLCTEKLSSLECYAKPFGFRGEGIAWNRLNTLVGSSEMVGSVLSDKDENNFPVLRSVHVFDVGSFIGSVKEERTRKYTVSIYPKKLSLSGMFRNGIVFDDSYFCNEKVRNIEFLEINGTRNLHTERWKYSFENLVTLRLNNVSISDALFQLRELKNLRELHVHNQPKEYPINGKNWKNCQNLEVLDLFSDNLYSPLVEKLRKLKYVNFASFTPYDFNCEHIDTVVLFGTEMSTKTSESLKKIKNLGIAKLPLRLEEYTVLKKFFYFVFGEAELNHFIDLFREFRFPRLERLWVMCARVTVQRNVFEDINENNFRNVKFFRIPETNEMSTILERVKFPNLKTIEVFRHTVRGNKTIGVGWKRKNLPSLEKIIYVRELRPVWFHSPEFKKEFPKVVFGNRNRLEFEHLFFFYETTTICSQKKRKIKD